MSNILFVSPSFSREVSGGDKTRRINYEILSELDGYRIIPFFIELKKNKLEKILAVLMGYKAGLNNHIAKRILQAIDKNAIDIVFVQGSLYGKLIKEIHQKHKDVVIIAFFHNCEYKIYSDSLKDKNVLCRRFVLKSVRVNENYTLLFSTLNILYNKRDSDLCETTYGMKIANKTIMPMVLKDTFANKSISNDTIIPDSLLFVGSYFFANSNGLLWFDKNVLPYIDYKLTIVGKGFEDDAFTSVLQSKDKIIIKGFVDDLNAEYENTDIVIQPVFEGAGMKTKTAECFMHGKVFVSTSEGLMGYDVNNMKNIYRCDTAEEFIKTLNHLKKEQVYRYNPNIRNLFLEKYSKESRKKIFATILREIF
jgi:glycosyltransferase involved in cell wall biosynthesis